MESYLMRRKYIVGGLVIFAVVVGLYWVLVPMKDTSESPSDDAPINFRYEKSEWLEEHPKQENIDGYVKKRKQEITNSAIELKREFPDSHLLPFVLEITIERVVVDAYESILITDHAYTGGAHGNTKYVSYTLRDGKDVSLAEYWPNRGYSYSEEGLLIRINNRLLSNKQKKIKSLNDVAWQVRAPDNEKQYSIRIIFPPGAVDAYVVGTITHIFDMPYSFTYEKPEWLEGHPKQETIDGYVKKRKEKIINSAIWYEKQEREFPKFRSVLPLTLEIIIERVVVDAYESILITDRAYTGGAHRNTIYAYYTFRDGKDVSLTEYLSDKGHSEEHLLELLNNRLLRDKYKTVKSFNDVAWQVHAPDSEKSIGIRIIFPPGTIEAYAAGTITYTF